MRLEHLPGTPELTYCTNIHAGESWAEIAESLDAHVPRIRELTAPHAPFGLGLRLSGRAAADLVGGDNLARFKDQLERLSAYVFTINAFPYGPFHGTRVKQEVYEPDWRAPERLEFTSASARVLAALLPEGGFGSISTVPGAFKPRAAEPGARAAIVDGLIAATADLVRLSRSSGRTIALALEPEPFCMLETVEETLAFFTQDLRAADPLSRLARATGLTTAQAEEALHIHLGVCYDVCHGAVEHEDPVAGIRMLAAAGIRIPKIQLSSAMRIPEVDAAALAELRRYDTGTYLHQVCVRADDIERYLDLPEAFAAYEAGRARGEWRVHCHLPVFLETAGRIASTRSDLLAVLAALRQEPLAPHLEVETYTWDILPEALKTGSKADDIARELAFITTELEHGRVKRDARALGGDPPPSRPDI
jgi:hypothetical protein